MRCLLVLSALMLGVGCGGSDDGGEREEKAARKKIVWYGVMVTPMSPRSKRELLVMSVIRVW